MKTKRYILILLCFLVASACRKKKYPVSETVGEPEFYIDATINGQAVRLSAGLNDYRMYTSFTQDSQGLYTLQGHLKTGDCASACPVNLKVSINNYTTVAAGAAININEALASGNREFITAPQSIEFAPTFNKPAASFSWDFGDGQQSALEKPTHSFVKPGTYVVKLKATSNTGCSSTIYNTVKVGNANVIESASILQTAAQGKVLSYRCQINGGTGPYSYYWSFGDGTHSTLSQPTHTYLVTGSYPVNVKIVDAKSDTLTAFFNAVTQNDLYSCAVNFSASAASSIQDVSPPKLSKVVLEWNDGAGNTFSSSKALQTKSSFFTITSVEDYENNENGQKTKKIRLRFQCDLKDNNNNLVKIENAEAVIGVAYN